MERLCLVLAALAAVALVGCTRYNGQVGERVSPKWRGIGPFECGDLYPIYRGHHDSIDGRGRGPTYGLAVECPNKESLVRVDNYYAVGPVERTLGHASKVFWWLAWLTVLGGVVGFLSLPALIRDRERTAVARRAGFGTASSGDIPTLEPLLCSQCGAAVPLASATDAVPCCHCSTRVPVPPAYRRAADLRLEAHREFQRAASVWRRYRQWTSPRWTHVTRLVRYSFVPLYGALLFGGFRSGVLSGGYVPFALCYLAIGLAFVWRGHRIIFGRADETLRALEPITMPSVDVRDGGSCRVCGAALAAVSPAEVVLLCLYCGTEHLLLGRVRRERALARARLTQPRYGSPRRPML